MVGHTSSTAQWRTSPLIQVKFSWGEGGDELRDDGGMSHAGMEQGYEVVVRRFELHYIMMIEE